MELDHRKVFGCPAYALMEEAEWSRLDPKSQKLIFIGYSIGMKGYLLWDPYFQKCIISRNMIFNERSILKKPKSMDRARKTAQDISEQHSQSSDLPLTSSSKHVQFEIELGRHGYIPIEHQQGEDAIWKEVQR